MTENPVIRETYLSKSEEECVIVDFPDGSYWSGLKSTWEEMQAQAELGGTL